MLVLVSCNLARCCTLQVAMSIEFRPLSFGTLIVWLVSWKILWCLEEVGSKCLELDSISKLVYLQQRASVDKRSIPSSNFQANESS